MWLTFIVVPYILKHTIPLHFPLASNYQIFTSRSRWIEKFRLGNIWDFNDGRKFNFLIICVTTLFWNLVCRFWRNILFSFFFYGASTCFRVMACCWRDFKIIQYLRSVDEPLHSTPKREGCKFLWPAPPSKSARHLWPYNRLGCRLHRLHILSFKQTPSLGCTGVPQFLLRGSHGIRDQSQGIRGCISVMATLKFTCFFNYKNDVFNLFNWQWVNFLWPLVYIIISETPCTHEVSGSECTVTYANGMYSWLSKIS
jgi:hypothetical protein